MNNQLEHSELLQLLNALCNDELGAKQFARLEEILCDDPAAQQIYFEYLDLHLALGHLIERPSEIVAPRAAPVDLGEPARHRWGDFVVSVGLLAAALLMIVFFAWPSMDREQTNVPTLTHLTGNAVVHASDGQSRAARVGTSLLAGERIATQGINTLAVLSYDDGTQLTLRNDSSASCRSGDQKIVSLHSGIASVQVTPQPVDQPMLVGASTADIKVVGTRFAIATMPNRTDLNVAAGRVRLTRKSDGQSIDVSQGRMIVTGDRSPLVIEKAGVAATWDADFENGLPDGWIGSHVMSNQPSGSQGAVTTVVDPNSELETHVISTRDEWVAGLFEVHDDTHLHITLKMERPDWLNIFFSTRDADPTQPSWTLHLFNEVPFWPPHPGQWRTITIPLKQFRSKRDGVFYDEPPGVSKVVYSLSVSFTEVDRGLVIDRMWITHGGPGQVEWNEP